MGDNIMVYITALQDSLRSKWDILKKILDLTEQQESVLMTEEVDFEQFGETLQKKETLIARLEELDKGFEEVFDRISVTLKENSKQYKPQILEMQNLIRTITEYSVRIQALEQKNKEKFTAAVGKKHREIRDFKISNKTAVSYYQNMANQHHEWQTYFFDKKK
jgi:flagellar biosynthesis/type III secretory pathway chaperone